MSLKDRNKQAYINFGLIAYSTIEKIEKVQDAIESILKQEEIVYSIVTARRLWLSKRGDMNE
jgi:hypothetical protein